MEGRADPAHLSSRSALLREREEAEEAKQAAADLSGPALVPTEFRPLTLASIKQLNHNTKLFRFAFPDAAARLPETNTAVFYFVQAVVEGAGSAAITRPYTPVSPLDTQGSLTLMVKVYPKPHGLMGNHLASLAIGAKVQFKGPIAKVEYAAGRYDHVVMLAGGSGITPMYQMLQTIWANPTDTATRVTLLFSNSTVQDVVLRNELKQLQSRRPGQLKVCFTVSRPPHPEEEGVVVDDDGHEKDEDDDSNNNNNNKNGAVWTGDTGRIDEAKLRQWGVVPEEGVRPLVLVCGPPAFMAAISGDKLFAPGQRPQQGELQGHLKALGFRAEQVFKF